LFVTARDNLHVWINGKAVETTVSALYRPHTPLYIITFKLDISTCQLLKHIIISPVDIVSSSCRKFYSHSIKKKPLKLR